MSTMASRFDWAEAATLISERGWVRIEGALGRRTCAEFIEAAPLSWEPLPKDEGPRQGGQSCGVFFDDASRSVREFGDEICNGLTIARSDLPPIPRFNEVQWGRSHDGVGFIAPHRDPPGIGGVIAIVTLAGRALFRVWQTSDVTEWETVDGDLVLLRGHGWPTEASRCPIHEARSPRVGERTTMTLRHNVGGPGADYFP